MADRGPQADRCTYHLTHDLGTAEELAQEALVAALEQWPREGIPRKPGAWLLTTARRRGIDQLRRRENLASKYQLIGEVLRDRAHEQDLLDAVDRIEDDVLRLVFITCHPVLPVESRVALALRVLGGLSVADIASAFLVTESAMAARITRAKKTLRQANVPFEVPEGADRARRVPDVLEVIYLIFNEGYSATSGDDAMRPLLCDEAIRLGRVIAELMPTESEVHGLLALMQLQASRANARSDRDGRPILLLDQDRRRWDRTLITLGLRSLGTCVPSIGHDRHLHIGGLDRVLSRAGAQAAGHGLGNRSSATTTFFGSPNRHQSLNSIVQSRSAKRVVRTRASKKSRSCLATKTC